MNIFFKIVIFNFYLRLRPVLNLVVDLADFYKLTILIVLLVIVVIIAISTMASLVYQKEREKKKTE